jgi:cation transport ATPase
MAGFMDVQDALRPDAKGTIEELHAAGIRTVMISGDNKAAAHEVAALVGIQPGDVYANVKPAGERCLVGQALSGIVSGRWRQSQACHVHAWLWDCCP